MKRGEIEQAENELTDIAEELTELGDMIPDFFLNTEDMEPETPGGIKILITRIRKRIDEVRSQIHGLLSGD
jgi:hypothetical protein